MGKSSLKYKIDKIIYQPSYRHYTGHDYCDFTPKKLFNESFSNIVLRIAGKSDLALVQLKKGPGHKNATVIYIPKC